MSKRRKLLQGVRVLEIAQVAAGPFAGSLLADLGADVVKVERPDEGDALRAWPPLTGEGDPFSESFACINRNKRSFAADLKDPDQVDMVRNLCAKADVVLENFRPGVLGRLGLNYDSVKKLNPAVVYCSVSGYGQNGPYATKGAFDLTVQAISGVMSVTGEDDRPPVKCGVPYGDFCAGLYAAYSIMAALFERERTGNGACIDCSMVGSLIGVAALQTAEYFGTGRPPKRLGSKHPRNSPYQAFRAKDKYFVIAAGTDRFWQLVCEALGVEHLLDDPRFRTLPLRAKNQDQLAPLLEPIFLRESAEHWLQEMDNRGVPCAPINTFQEILEDPHIAEMGLVVDMELPNGAKTKTTAFPVRISDYAFEVFRNPPKIGADTADVMAEWTGKDLHAARSPRKQKSRAP